MPRLKAHPFSDFLQFMRLGIRRLLGVNEGKHGTCVAVNANPAMLPPSTTLLKVMLQDKSFRDNVLIFAVNTTAPVSSDYTYRARLKGFGQVW